MSGDGLLSDEQSSTSLTGHSVTSPGADSQESSWIGLLSLVSRPAFSFLQNRLPGRTQPSALCDRRVDSFGGGIKNFVDEESEFLRQLDDVMPQHAAYHLSYLPGPHGGAVSPWLTADSLREVGIRSAVELALNHLGQPGSPDLRQQGQPGSPDLRQQGQPGSPDLRQQGQPGSPDLRQQGQPGSPSPSRNLLNHVWLISSTSQEVQPSEQMDWEVVASPVKSTGGTSRMRWDSFWRANESSERGLFSDLSQAKEGTLTGRLCRAASQAETDSPGGEAAVVVIQSSSRGGTLAGTTGLSDRKEQWLNMGQLKLLRSLEAPSSPDQDHGYSSLEEEQLLVRALRGQQDVRTGLEEEPSTSQQADEEEETQKEGCVQPAEALVLNTPHCQNKAIAFIMGCPCSDDDRSQSGESSDDGDDGFDSEDFSDLSDSTDEDDDEGSDSEVERLWSSLCQSVDPYNPQNFTARLHTSTLPRPTPTPPSSNQSSPASSPGPTAQPLSSSPFNQEVWEDSSASDVDEAENLRLWSSFTCFADPYNPRNFKASLRTQGSTVAGTRFRDKKASHIPFCSSNHDPAPPPEHRRDRSCSGPTTSSRTQSCRSTKKVRFQDHVEEFFISCGEEDEDRKGPWEELARDRCRFLRRCQEVEQSLAYCLQPEHRCLVRRRLAAIWVQDQ